MYKQGANYEIKLMIRVLPSWLWLGGTFAMIHSL